MKLRAAEFSPTDYTKFAHQWMALKVRVQADEDLVRWPWEPNDLEVALRRLQAEGSLTVARLTKERESLRRSAEDKITRVENRFRVMTLQVNAIDSRLLPGQRFDEIELSMNQAHSLYEQGQYNRSLDALDRATQSLATQAAWLNSELGRYADRDRISRWQEMAKYTITWSRTHRTSAIVINKADRVLTLYKTDKQYCHTLSVSGSMVFGRSNTRKTEPPRKADIESAAREGRGRPRLTRPWFSTIPTKMIGDATNSGGRRDRFRHPEPSGGKSKSMGLRTN